MRKGMTRDRLEPMRCTRDSAVEMAETKKESILAALGQGHGPVE